MAELNGRAGGRRRRIKNEINMVPFIDVMLVLLIIFMVSAPLMPTGVVDLPSVGKARQAPDKVIEGVVDEIEVESSVLAPAVNSERQRSVTRVRRYAVCELSST